MHGTKAPDPDFDSDSSREAGAGASKRLMDNLREREGCYDGCEICALHCFLRDCGRIARHGKACVRKARGALTDGLLLG